MFAISVTWITKWKQSAVNWRLQQRRFLQVDKPEKLLKTMGRRVRAWKLLKKMTWSRMLLLNISKKVYTIDHQNLTSSVAGDVRSDACDLDTVHQLGIKGLHTADSWPVIFPWIIIERNAVPVEHQIVAERYPQDVYSALDTDTYYHSIEQLHCHFYLTRFLVITYYQD